MKGVHVQHRLGPVMLDRLALRCAWDAERSALVMLPFGHITLELRHAVGDHHVITARFVIGTRRLKVRVKASATWQEGH